MMWTLIKKEFTIEWRTRETLIGSLFFALLLSIIGSFCFGVESGITDKIVPGFYWMVLTFSSTLLITRSFRQGQEEAEVQGCLLAGVSPETLFLAKAFYNWILTGVVGLAVLFMISIFYNFNFGPHLAWLIPLILLVNIGVCSLGTFCAAMLRSTRLRHLLVPLIFYPLVLPLVIPAIRATESLLQQQSVEGLPVILSFNIIYGAVTYMLFSELVEG